VASGKENDVVVEGSFVEQDTSSELCSQTSLTVIRIEIEPEHILPLNPVVNRHAFGLREKVFCRSYPYGANVLWTDNDEGDTILIALDGSFHVPWVQGEYGLAAVFGGVQLDANITVYEPTVECRSAMWRSELQGEVGTSGKVGMSLALYLNPSMVSFSYIHLQEIPEYVAVPPSGYFSVQNGLLPPTHDTSAGAGIWRQPWPRNDGTYWTDDAVQMPYACPPLPGMNPPSWSDGTLRWNIPVGWGNGSTVVGRMEPNPTTQVFHMDADGTLSISKYLHVIMRSVDGRVWLDGSRVNAWWNDLF